MKEKIAAILKTLPEKPGVYLMRDIDGKLISVVIFPAQFIII